MLILIFASSPLALIVGAFPVAAFAIVTSLTAEPVAVSKMDSLPFASLMPVVMRGEVARRFPLPAVTFVPSDVKPLTCPTTLPAVS